MIDIANERIIPLGRATELFPGREPGKRAHPSAAIRAAKRGSRTPTGARITLEHVRLGGRLFTSIEAVQRYAERLTAAWADASGDTAPAPPASRRKSHERADAALVAAGF